MESNVPLETYLCEDLVLKNGSRDVDSCGHELDLDLCFLLDGGIIYQLCDFCEKVVCEICAQML